MRMCMSVCGCGAGHGGEYPLPIRARWPRPYVLACAPDRRARPHQPPCVHCSAACPAQTYTNASASWPGRGRLAPATSAPGLGSPVPHLHRVRAHPCHICTGTGLTPATSAPGLGSPLPHLHRDWAHPCHICTGSGLTRATSAPGLRSPLPHLHRDRAGLSFWRTQPRSAGPACLPACLIQ
jgi:hypothetical protein